MEKKATTGIKADIPTPLRNEFKSACAMKNLTITEVMEKMIRQWLQAEKNTSEHDVTGDDFLKMLDQKKKPTAIQIGILADSRGLSLELLEKITDCILKEVVNEV